MRSAGGRQAEVRLQPGQAFGLRASGDRADRHAGWLSSGLRSHGREYLGQDDAASVSGQDRDAIRQGATHLGDGSRHSDRGSPGRDARLADANPLSRGHAARAADQARKGARSQTVGGGARERASQADRARRGDLCPGPQRKPAGKGTGDAAASAAQTDQASARTATTRPDARRTAAQARRGQERGRQGLWAAGDPHADEGPAGHAANFPFHAGSQEIARRAPPRGRLSAALQHQRRRPRPSLETLSAIGRDRTGLQGAEERPFDPTDPSSVGDPDRSSHFRCVSGLLPDGHAETTAEGAGAGTDAPGRARKARRDANDRRRVAHDGRTHRRSVAIYRTRSRSPAPAATPEARPPRPAAAENHGLKPSRSRLSEYPCSADFWTRAPAISMASPR